MGCGLSRGTHQHRRPSQTDQDQGAEDPAQSAQAGDDVMGSSKSKIKAPTAKNHSNPAHNEAGPAAASGRLSGHHHDSDQEAKNSIERLSAKLKADRMLMEGSIQPQTEVSSSQIDFFKMLDEKIENGIELDEARDAEARREEMQRSMEEWDNHIQHQQHLNHHDKSDKD